MEDFDGAIKVVEKEKNRIRNSMEDIIRDLDHEVTARLRADKRAILLAKGAPP